MKLMRNLIILMSLGLVACSPSMLRLPFDSSHIKLRDYQFKMAHLNINNMCDALKDDSLLWSCNSSDDINILIENSNLYQKLNTRSMVDAQWARRWKANVSESTHKLASSGGLTYELNRRILEELYPGLLPVTIKPSKTRRELRVAVIDFDDKTEGNHGLDWSGACSYQNTASVLADAVALVLQKNGMYSSVSRKRTLNEAQESDIIVSGEIRQFQAGGRPHPTVFINPVCAFSLLGLPTAYANTYRVGDISVYVKDMRTGDVLSSIPIFVNDSNWRWVSPYYLCLDHKTHGNEILEMISYKFSQSLNLLESTR